ncbi:MAG: hypothetical protein HFE52_04275 [Clostridia bacterium]|nr:hypothetical protein [Clostridia bacterium]
MGYWIILIILFIILIGILFFGWKKIIVDKNTDKEVLGGLVFFICMLLVFLIPLSIDIRSALKGGQEIYVNELPTRRTWGAFSSYIDTDNEVLKDLIGCNWNVYEKYGNYHIRYTKFTKFVLDVEKLD